MKIRKKIYIGNKNIQIIHKNTLSIITTNRQSAFNKIICEIENKGLIQTLFTDFWVAIGILCLQHSLSIPDKISAISLVIYIIIYYI